MAVPTPARAYEDPRRETPLPNGDSKNSAVSDRLARFGVTSRYLCSAIEIQIKMAQGARKPARAPARQEGVPWIAEVR